MSLTIDRSLQRFHRLNRSSREISLSTYFPPGTQYFYGYPAGEDSGFLNRVLPITEELVAARAASCAGDGVTVIGFAATNTPQVPSAVFDIFGIPRLGRHQRITLPSTINAGLRGARRNQAIKTSLAGAAQPNQLVMAQPYDGDDVQHLYQIPAKLTRWLNDKSTMNQYIAAELMPARLGTYDSGAAFAADCARLKLPFVVKAAASSAGDGVFICQTAADLRLAVKSLKRIAGTVLVEQYVVAIKNYGIHFGIPYDERQPIDVFGVNEQLTTPAGEFIGGIIHSTEFPSHLGEIAAYLRDEVLPKVRSMGWYGLGCFDVLVDQQERFYFIDCNFRMTGMSAYHCLLANGQLVAPLIGFGGEFKGSQADLERALLPYASLGAPQKIMQLIALSRHGKSWRFNAALCFDGQDQMAKYSQRLLDLGVRSAALQQIAKNA